MSPRRRAASLETVHVTVPDEAVEAYERALASVCSTVGIFEADDTQTLWRVEGVKDEAEAEPALAAALALASAATGLHAALQRRRTPAEGWLARTYEAFPEQRVGRRFLIRGTHLPADRGQRRRARIAIALDAGVAFGSGEHGSTRGCLRALEQVAHRRPRRIVDVGTGSGILAMAAAALLHRPALGVDIEPWSVRVAAQNARLNHLHPLLSYQLGDGWRAPAARSRAPYDLVFANILARPLCRMALPLGARLKPGGTAILSGLLDSQVRMVLAAHRRRGMVLEAVLREGQWATLILRRPVARR